MIAMLSPVQYKWRSIITALVLTLGGCGGEEPPPEPPVTPKVASTTESSAVEAVTPPASTEAAIDPIAQEQGRDIYVHYCADCHDAGEGHPGTMRLAARLDAGDAVLTTRADLAPDYVKLIVRNGLGMMPAFRPTEVTDVELDALAGYIVNANDTAAGAAK